jgi:hypothetical protein
MGICGNGVKDHRDIESTQYLTWLLTADEVLKNFSQLMNSKGCGRRTEDGHAKGQSETTSSVKVLTNTHGMGIFLAEQ